MTAALTVEAAAERSTREPLIELDSVVRIYRTGKLEYPALRGVNLAIEAAEIPEAGHVGGFQTRPDAYERRVTRFFDWALWPSAGPAGRDARPASVREAGLSARLRERSLRWRP